MPVVDRRAFDKAGHRIGGGVGNAGREQRIAVTLGSQNFLRAHGTRGTGLIDHDDVGAELLGQNRRGDARHLIGSAAGAPRHDDVDGTIGRPLLGEGRHGGRRNSRDRDCGHQ